MAVRIYFTVNLADATAESDSGHGSDKRRLSLRLSDQRPLVHVDDTRDATYYVSFDDPLALRLPTWMQWVDITHATLREQIYPGPLNQVSIIPGVYGTPHGISAQVTAERDHWLIRGVVVAMRWHDAPAQKPHPENELITFYGQLLDGEAKPIKTYRGNGKGA